MADDVYGIVDSFLWYIGLASFILIVLLVFRQYLRWRHENARSQQRQQRPINFITRKKNKTRQEIPIAQEVNSPVNQHDTGYLPGPENYIMRVLIPDERNNPEQSNSPGSIRRSNGKTVPNVIIKTDQIIVTKRRSSEEFTESSHSQSLQQKFIKSEPEKGKSKAEVKEQQLTPTTKKSLFKSKGRQAKQQISEEKFIREVLPE